MLPCLRHLDQQGQLLSLDSASMLYPAGGGVNAVDSSKARMKNKRNFEQDKLIFV